MGNSGKVKFLPGKMLDGVKGEAVDFHSNDL